MSVLYTEDVPQESPAPEPRKKLSGGAWRLKRAERGLPKYTDADRASWKRRRKTQYVKKDGRTLRVITQEIKMARGCADCGYNAHPAALEFDHLPGKDKLAGVSELVARGLKEQTLAEVDKCEVVCANCHRIRTAERTRRRIIAPQEKRGVVRKLTADMVREMRARHATKQCTFVQLAADYGVSPTSVRNAVRRFSWQSTP